MAKGKKNKLVALALPLGVPHIERIVHSILRHGRWRFTVNTDSLFLSARSLQGWSGDGLITWINTRAEARAVAQLGIPAVNISGALGDAGVARVTIDNRAVGRLAAEHLLECGFRRFAYYGVRGLQNAQQRGAGFVETVEAAGGTCSVFNGLSTLVPHPKWEQINGQLQRWLRSLAPPVGLLAYSDYRARMVIEACEWLGLEVPDDVAVIGVNNDQMVCELCEPPLTSVSHDADKSGCQIVAILDRLMAGKKAPLESVLILPEGVVRRRSTDTTAVEDPKVAAAVRFIRQHLDEPIDVHDLLRHTDVSRRWLENAFSSSLGHTPYEHICHVRVQRAKQLLTGADRPRMDQIARACGFLDAKRMRIVFRRLVGTSPYQYYRSQMENGTRHRQVAKNIKDLIML